MGDHTAERLKPEALQGMVEQLYAVAHNDLLRNPGAKAIVCINVSALTDHINAVEAEHRALKDAARDVLTTLSAIQMTMRLGKNQLARIERLRALAGSAP